MRKVVRERWNKIADAGVSITSGVGILVFAAAGVMSARYLPIFIRWLAEKPVDVMAPTGVDYVFAFAGGIAMTLVDIARGDKARRRKFFIKRASWLFTAGLLIRTSAAQWIGEVL